MEEIAEVYARSLFEVAQEHDKLDDDPRAARRSSPTSSTRTASCRCSSSRRTSRSEEKKDGIGKVVEGADEHFVHFLELLAERHRMPVIFRIRREFDGALGRGEQAARR